MDFKKLTNLLVTYKRGCQAWVLAYVRPIVLINETYCHCQNYYSWCCFQYLISTIWIHQYFIFECNELKTHIHSKEQNILQELKTNIE